MGLQLSYADIIPTIIHLRVTMVGDGLTIPQQAFDTFRIPGDYNFLATEVRAHVALNTPTTQTAGTAGLNALYGIKNRIAVKAMNAKALLVNADRNDLTFVEPSITNSSANGAVQSPLVLGTLMPICGGAPIKLIDHSYVAPLIVPANERLQLTINLTNAEVAEGSVEYGLVLPGALVRMRAG